MYSAEISVQTVVRHPVSNAVIGLRPSKLVSVHDGLYKCLFHVPVALSKHTLDRLMTLIALPSIRIEYDLDGRLYRVSDAQRPKKSLKLYRIRSYLSRSI